MRRTRLRLLANCTRLLLLGICCTAGGTAAIWNWRSEWVVATDAWLQRRYVATFRERFDAITKVADHKQRADGCATLLAELDWVRRQDRLADVVGGCLQHLSSVAENTGDLVAAAQWMQRAVDFDDHDVLTANRLAGLECRIPEQRANGLARLTQLLRQFPGHPVLANSLAQNLAAAERPAEAATVIDNAMTALHSNLWTIAWDTGPGPNNFERRVETIASPEGDEIVFRFRVAEPIFGLQIFPPTFHSGRIDRARLRCGANRQIDLFAATTATYQLRIDGNAAATFGSSGASWTVHWDEPIPADTHLELFCREQLLPEFALEPALTTPQLGAWLDAPPAPADESQLRRLRRARARVGGAGDLQVFWCAGNATFDAAHSRLAQPVPTPTDDGCAFTGRFAIDAAVARLRLDFPDGVGTSYAVSTFALTLPDRTLAIDLATIELQTPHNVERRGDRFVVTGGDPYFTFTLPTETTIRDIAIAGDAR